MDKTAAIFVHPYYESPCLLKQILEERGFAIQIIQTPLVQLKDFDALEPDLLLIMGGVIGVHQVEDYPFLYDEIAVIKQRINADKPTLGICLGSQLIAKALGKEVYPGSMGKEIGWHDLTITDQGQTSPIRHFSKDLTKMMQWHGDTFDLPDGAILLASSEKYKYQAFSYGKNVIAVQFHPEVTRNRIKEWEISQYMYITGPNALMSINDLREQTDKYIETLNVQTRKFLLEWLEEVGL